jgi:hypothetical protein
MGNKQIRIGQLIAPFGPGSLYTDRRGTPHIVCGLDNWFKRQNNGELAPCDDSSEFAWVEPRLSDLLGVDRFCTPPDFREVRTGMSPPPNAMLKVPALRFPCWYRHTKTGQMKRFNLDTIRISPENGGRWQPVRFISVCSAGHLCEFPWKQWSGCQCPGDGSLELIDRGGSELSSITVRCKDCGKKRTLSGSTVKPDCEAGEKSAFQKAGICCPGDRPWLGEGANQNGCTQPLIGALINQTNLYFPKTISAISLPDFRPENNEIGRLMGEIQEDQAGLGVAMSIWNMGTDFHEAAANAMKSRLGDKGGELDDIQAALENIMKNGAALPDGADKPGSHESALLAFRRAEFNIIRNEVNDPVNVPNLRVIPTRVSNDLDQWIERVNLVERLRETRVMFGFDRLEQNNKPLEGMPQSAMEALFRDPPMKPTDRWLPAIGVFGEGIYLELKEKSITEWQKNCTEWLGQRLEDRFINRVQGVFQTLAPEDHAHLRQWASRYLLVHSLAHILINQLVFECGYGTASLRERLYVSADPAAPMAAFMIYTAAGDSEGTLGGLVRLGRPERLAPVIRRAISRASWCSADPVCSEHLGGQGSKSANLAACHACVLLPETSCETINHGLDRSMVVGLPENRSVGFMKDIVESITLG